MSLASLRNCTSLLALALTCQGSFAQGTPGDWTNVESLAVDAKIAVTMKAGEKYHGELVGVTADSLTVDSDEPVYPGRATRRRELKREDIREIRRVAPTTSLIAGAGIGAGVGAGIGVGLDSTAKSHEYRGAVALGLGILGAIIGAAIAHHHPFIKGQKIYVAP